MHSEDLLVMLMGAVVITCWIAGSNKRGLILFSVKSYLDEGAKKYREKKGKRKPYFISLSVALALNLLIALIFTRDIAWIAVFITINMIFITYCLRSFVLLEVEK